MKGQRGSSSIYCVLGDLSTISFKRSSSFKSVPTMPRIYLCLAFSVKGRKTNSCKINKFQVRAKGKRSEIKYTVRERKADAARLNFYQRLPRMNINEIQVTRY